MRRLTDASADAVARLVVAATGVIALHQIAYLLAHPSTVGRAVAADGHGYLDPIASVVVPAAVAVGAWGVVCRLSSPTSTGRGVPVVATSHYMALFVAQETLERLTDGQSPFAVLAEPAVWVGLALAPALALLGRMIARSIERADAVGSASLVLPARPVVGSLTALAPALPVLTLTPATRRVRGPPVSLR